jgi:bifunctional ADP-heptose synthase (sugar kinase/adenylyltransferase)
VDRASNVRVFETYNLPHDDYSQKNRDFAKLLPMIDPDVITVVDYGHGFIDETVIAELGNTKIQVSANAQSNAGNRGFNPISRYKGIPILFLNGSEVEVETRTKTSDLKSTVESLANGLETDEFYVTNGSGGLICWKKDAETFIAPAFAPSIVDRTGAGDALLSSVTLLRRSGVEREIAAFYGNISGALLIGAMGNELSLSRDMLLEQAEEIVDTVMKGE